MHRYRKETYPALVKYAYIGEISRGLFPLSPAFAKKSNNSWVAINGKARVVQVPMRNLNC